MYKPDYTPTLHTEPPATAMSVLLGPSHTLGKSLRTQADTHIKAPRLREPSRTRCLIPSHTRHPPSRPSPTTRALHVTQALVHGVDRNQTPLFGQSLAPLFKKRNLDEQITRAPLDSQKVYLSGAGKLKTHMLTWGAVVGGIT